MQILFNAPRRIIPCLFLLLLSLLVLTGPAAGGVFEGNSEIGFDFGGVDGDEVDHDDHRGSDGGRFALRGGYHLNDRLQLEAQLLGIGVGDVDGVDALGAVFANVVFNWHPKETVVPYVLVGLGALESYGYDHHHRHHDHPDHRRRHRDFDDDEASAAVQVGVGSRFFFGRGSRTALRLEASLLAYEDAFERDRELLSLSVGLTWRIGKSKPSKVTVAGER